MSSSTTETILCPLCAADQYVHFATDNGFTAVKCKNCGLVYVNPRPVAALIEQAVETGLHREVADQKSVVYHRVPGKVGLYKEILSGMFADVWASPAPIAWLDVGAGYGEVVEAVAALAGKGSRIEGIEPMKPKAAAAQARGLNVRSVYLSELAAGEFDYVSLINVFSHLPDFRSFLVSVKRVLKPQGELFIETGNIADLADVSQAPVELDLPDHLVFVGEPQLARFLQEAGFQIVKVEKRRRDGLLAVGKNVIKRVIGRRVNLTMPYTSAYRTLLIRASIIDPKN